MTYHDTTVTSSHRHLSHLIPTQDISKHTWKGSLYYQEHLNTVKDDCQDTGQLGATLYEGTRHEGSVQHRCHNTVVIYSSWTKYNH